jgi:pimeloyl-ACP methyl ester carboxylesterase
MSTYLLVHGAWHGGWCWRRVAEILKSHGHNVFAPTLTGLGERAHLIRPKIDLELHVQDILGVLHYEDLQAVILVGHSYGGMVITGVAERATDRMHHLIYLDAQVPRNNQSLASLAEPLQVENILRRARTYGDGWRVPPLPVDKLGLTDPSDIRWVQSKLTDQPLKTLFQPLQLVTGTEEAIPRTYIYCTNPPLGFFEKFAKQAQSEGWPYFELQTGHDAMITRPQELADLLLKAAE